MAPAHATVDSTLAKFRMPGTSCLTTCALAAVAIRPTTVNSARVGFSGRMPAPPFERCSLPLRVSPCAPCGVSGYLVVWGMARVCPSGDSENGSLNGSLWRKILQQVHGRGQVIVSGDGVDLPLAQLNECLGLDPLRHSVRAVVRQHVVGELGGPCELARRQCLAPACQHLVGATDEADQLCCAIFLRKRNQVGGVSVEPAHAVRVNAASGPFDGAVELLEVWVLSQIGWKLDVLHELVGALAALHALNRLVQDRCDAVVVRRERGARSGATHDGPRVARHHVLRSKLDHLLETGDPIL